MYEMATTGAKKPTPSSTKSIVITVVRDSTAYESPESGVVRDLYMNKEFKDNMSLWAYRCSGSSESAEESSWIIFRRFSGRALLPLD